MTLTRTSIVAGVASVAWMASAHAGCTTVNPVPAAEHAGAMLQAVWHPSDTTAGFVPVSTSDSSPAIVGLWKFEMIAKSTATNRNPMPDGVLVDFGTAAWHADGTEFQTSGSRNPGDGDVCQGVWTQVGPETFRLNHFALAWTNGTYTGPVNIRARVTVAGNRMSYSGPFQTDVYLASETPGHEFDQTTKLVTITGTFTATRVTIGN
jgi:hypothetical protein